MPSFSDSPKKEGTFHKAVKYIISNVFTEKYTLGIKKYLLSSRDKFWQPRPPKWYDSLPEEKKDKDNTSQSALGTLKHQAY